MLFSCIYFYYSYHARVSVTPVTICFYSRRNLGGFYYKFYVISVVLLVFILCDTVKMVTGVTETRRRQP